MTKTFSRVALFVRSLSWGIALTTLALAVCFIPGINLICYSLIITLGMVAHALGVPEKFIVATICIIFILGLLTFLTVLRFRMLARRNNLN